MKKIRNKVMRVTAVIMLCLSAAFPLFCSAETYEELTGYRDYLNSREETYPDEEILIYSDSLDESSLGCEIREYCGRTAVVTTDESNAVFSFTVETPGFYSMAISYCGVENKKSDMLRSISVNGSIPYDEASNIAFTRIYTNETDELTVDSQGNQVRPRQVEVFEWQTAEVRGSSGYFEEPLRFWLDAGENTVAFTALAEPMAIYEVRFFKWTETISYGEYKRNSESLGTEGETLRIQGEDAKYKSSYSMAPLSVTGSADMDPVSLTETRYNAIGGSNWSSSGETVTWEFEIDEPGDYQIVLRVLQGGSSGSVSSRDILIDGQTLFSELNGYAFKYSHDWHNVTLGTGEETFIIPFETGRHTITMRVSLGGLAPILEGLENEVEELNEIYRQLLVIMGTDPDVYRDYQFELYIPEVIEELKARSEAVRTLGEELQEYLGTKTGDTQFLERFSEQLLDMYEEETAIAKNYSSFQNNISTLADYVAGAVSQPLTVDYIELVPAGQTVPDGKTGFLESFIFGCKRFILSFISDYGASTAGDGSVEVWIGTGRDQSQIINMLSGNDFTAKTGISVDLKLVPMTALLPAALADNCPDVALSLPSADIANYAFRGALERLDGFEGIDEIKKRFSPSALVPLTYEDALYALPETQTFYVMFYRRDIFSMLNLEVPQTWQDIFEILPVLQKNNMSIGMPENRMHFLTMVMNQYGTELYNSDNTATQIDSDEAIEAFSMITSLFADYEIPQTINFVSRFRSGSIPIGIAEYTTYNTLEVSAPELSGTWGFAPVPGVETEDGAVSNSSVGVTTGCVLMSKGKNPENGFKFIEWWTSAEVQSEYGVQIENQLGSSARYASANLETLSNLPWIKSDYETLLSLWENVRGIPEVPGGYYMTREINFAFSAVVNNRKDVSDELSEAALEINNEITSKRLEFGMASEKE